MGPPQEPRKGQGGPPEGKKRGPPEEGRITILIKKMTGEENPTRGLVGGGGRREEKTGQGGVLTGIFVDGKGGRKFPPGGKTKIFRGRNFWGTLGGGFGLILGFPRVFFGGGGAQTRK